MSASSSRGWRAAHRLILRKSTLEALKLWMPTADVEKLIEPNYREATPEEAAKLGATSKEPLMILSGGVDEKTAERLNALFSRAFMINSVLSGDSAIDVGALLAAKRSPRAQAKQWKAPRRQARRRPWRLFPP